MGGALNSHGSRRWHDHPFGRMVALDGFYFRGTRYEKNYPPPRVEAMISILLVDDHPENLLALEATLSGMGANLVKAGSGPEALRALLEQEFALVLTDITMPGMTGFDLAELIHGREQTRLVPIMYLTATEPISSKLDCGYASGAVDYLIKPINPEILRAKVQVFLELDRQRKALKEQAGQLSAQALELLQSNEDLTRFNRLMAGREMRVIELKQQVNDLATRLGEPPPFPLVFLDAAAAKLVQTRTNPTLMNDGAPTNPDQELAAPNPKPNKE